MYALGYDPIPARPARQFHHPRVQSCTEIPTESHAERVHYNQLCITIILS